jgi:hypothetical protein
MNADTATSGGDARALAHLRGADPVLARVIDAHPGLDPRGWLRERPAMTPVRCSRPAWRCARPSGTATSSTTCQASRR